MMESEQSVPLATQHCLLRIDLGGADELLGANGDKRLIHLELLYLGSISDISPVAVARAGHAGDAPLFRVIPFRVTGDRKLPHNLTELRLISLGGVLSKPEVEFLKQPAVKMIPYRVLSRIE